MVAFSRNVVPVSSGSISIPSSAGDTISYPSGDRILEISFNHEPTKEELPLIGRDIRKLGAQVANKLDYKANR